MTRLAARAWRPLSEIGAFLGSARGLARVAIAVGIILRVIAYGNDRTLWQDEISLRDNVVGRPIFELDRPLVRDQLAPPGFLVVARISSHLLGHSSYALRFVPLVCGITSLFLLSEVARRTVAARAVPIALALAAVSDDLIYYSTEFKQYSSDLLIALGCYLLAWDVGGKALTPSRLAKAASLGAVATWCSHPSVFVLAGAGLWLASRAAVERRWRRVAALAVLGGVWASSFVACFVVSRRLLGGRQFMWVWWNFAFLPLPPRSLDEVGRVFWPFANVFSNPVGIVTPLTPVGSAFLSLGLFALGGLSLARGRRWEALVFLTSPILLMMLASALHRYPFHGRLLLFLVPSFLLPLAEGVDAVGRRCGRVVLAALVVLLLVTATGDAIDRIDRPHIRPFDSHADQRNDLLDYLETKNRRPIGRVR